MVVQPLLRTTVFVCLSLLAGHKVTAFAFVGPPLLSSPSRSQPSRHPPRTLRQAWETDFDEFFLINEPSSLLVSRNIPVQTLDSTRSFLDAVEQAPPNELVVVFFHAHYCKQCQRSNIQYRKLAHQNDHDNVHFYRLETSPLSVDHLRALGVSQLPWVQIYRHGTCVANFGTKQHTLETKLTGALQACHARTLTQWMALNREYEQAITENKRARQALRIEPTLQGPVMSLTRPSQLLQVLEDENDDETLSVVMVHSRFVESCRRAQYQFRRAAERYQGRQHKVQFYRVEEAVLESEDWQGLGVYGFPWIQIYRGGRLVASVGIGNKSYMFSRVVQGAIDASLAQMEEERDVVLDTAFDETRRQNKSARERIHFRQLRP